MDDTSDNFTFKCCGAPGSAEPFSTTSKGNRSLQTLLQPRVVKYPEWNVFAERMVAVLNGIAYWDVETMEDYGTTIGLDGKYRSSISYWNRPVAQYHGCEVSLYGKWANRSVTTSTDLLWSYEGEVSYQLTLFANGILYVMFGSEIGGKCNIVGKLDNVLKLLFPVILVD